MSIVHKERILVPFEGDTIANTIYQALGSASACWDNLLGAGVFDSTRAKQIGDELIDIIDKAFQEDIDHLMDRAQTAWGIIANAHEGDWSKAPQMWQDAATRWRDGYHEDLNRFLTRPTRERPIEPVEPVEQVKDTLVIEVTRKGKFVQAYGPFNWTRANEITIEMIEDERNNGGKHDFMMRAPRDISTEQPVDFGHWSAWMTQAEYDDHVSPDSPVIYNGFFPRIATTADLDAFDRSLRRQPTVDDVPYSPDPWPGTGKHRKPWAGN